MNDSERQDGPPVAPTGGVPGPEGGDRAGVERRVDRGHAFVEVLARRLAHGRTGDKGNRCSISVIAWRPEFYSVLVDQLTEGAVRAQFGHRRPSAVTRYLLPTLEAMNFVLDDVLDGGVNDSLNLDSHGKALSFLLLSIPIRIPADLVPLLAGDEPGPAHASDQTHQRRPR